ncbi:MULTISPECIES: ferredoxin [Rhodococcus]|uniref:ferredoxin n=1 Tax=Rhodococcus TaxID=1827 RepID=UPI002E2046D9
MPVDQPDNQSMTRARIRSNQMELSLHPGRCEGYGLCEEAAPRIYHLPDEDDVEILQPQVPSELEREASAGARVCPVAAILVSR